MRCAWDKYLSIIPHWMRDSVDRQGRACLQELRLRLNSPPELITSFGSTWLNRNVTEDDIQFCINAASKYSPWAAASSAQGFITAPGGHRIGVCGEAIISEGKMIGIRTVTMLCVRVARDFQGIANNLPLLEESLLIIGCPGSGKTTLLRDLIRNYSNNAKRSIAVIDERGEIFPSIHGQSCFQQGKRTDVLSSCGKPQGIEIVLRCMGPGAIAVDEITAEEDCAALIQAGWCGVQIFATAHAGSKKDLFSRPVYKSIVESQLFDSILVLHEDKSWTLERM